MLTLFDGYFFCVYSNLLFSFQLFHIYHKKKALNGFQKCAASKFVCLLISCCKYDKKLIFHLCVSLHDIVYLVVKMHVSHKPCISTHLPPSLSFALFPDLFVCYFLRNQYFLHRLKEGHLPGRLNCKSCPVFINNSNSSSATDASPL